MAELEVYVPFSRLREYGYPWSRTHVRRLVRGGLFPPPVELSPNRIAWRKSDLLASQEKRREQRWVSPVIVEAAPAAEDAAKEAPAAQRDAAGPGSG